MLYLSSSSASPHYTRGYLTQKKNEKKKKKKSIALSTSDFASPPGLIHFSSEEVARCFKVRDGAPESS